MDERLREAIRAFEGQPGEAAALTLLRAAQRGEDGALRRRACRWLADASRWDGLDASTRQAVGEALAAADRRLAFAGVEEHALGAQRHRVAMFTRGDVRLALIPGGTVRLGWEGDLDAVLAGFDGRTADAFAAEFGEPTLSPARTVTLEPFLLETAATFTGEGILADSDPEEPIVAALGAALAADGLRLPTPDEWEHACAAGARTYFRWGNDWPPGGPFGRGEFDLHRRPNAYGIVYPSDTYACECTSEEYVLCHGDGGGLVHGGSNRAAWITLGTAYRASPDLVEDLPDESYEMAVVRRALSLA